MIDQRSLLAIGLILICSQVFAQIKFEKGYYVDNKGEKINCLIRNVDWKNNPTEIDIKLTEDSEIQNLQIQDIRAFEILDESSFKRFRVGIDRSSPLIKKLSPKRQPDLNDETLFLQELVVGSASLYYYEDVNLTRFFYNQGDSLPTLLIYKKYRTEKNTVGENNDYKQELLNTLKCTSITYEQVTRLSYRKQDLVKFFNQYNNCKGDKVVLNEDIVNKKGVFHLGIRPGILSNSLSLERGRRIPSPSETDFGNNVGYRIGLELEFVFPFNKNKWSILLEPIYNSYSANGTTLDTFAEAEVDYNYIEIPLGVRHYFFLTDRSKLFLNGLVSINLDLDSEITYSDDRTSFPADRGIGWGAGFGYNHNNRITAEFRYNGRRDILSAASTWSAFYTGFSLIVGYNFF